MNNQITLVGRVGGDPVSTTFTDTNNKLAKFSIAVADYSSKEDNPEPMWIDVESWNNLAERVLKTITEESRGRNLRQALNLQIHQGNKRSQSRDESPSGKAL
jgi:single-stranded DNA-binding protein